MPKPVIEAFYNNLLKHARVVLDVKEKELEIMAIDETLDIIVENGDSFKIQ